MSVTPETAAPTGRKKPAQGKERSDAALGHQSQNTSSPEGAKEGWPTVQIGDSLKLINGRAFKPTEWKKTGTPIVRIQNLNNPQAPYNYFEGDLPEKFLLDDGDLLFAWSGTPGTSFGAHIWRGGKAWLNQHIFKVEFDETQFDTKFLQLAINQNLAEYIRVAHGGAGLAHITKGRFEESELPQPEIPEQERIVAEIEKQFTRLDAGVTALRRVQSNLKRYRAAVLQAACEGRLVPTEAQLAEAGNRKAKFETGQALLVRILTERRQNWQGRGKYKEPDAPDDRNLQPLPEGWTWASVAQLSFLDVGFAFKSAEFQKSGVRLLRGENLEPGKMRWADTRYWPESKLDEFRHLLIREGEIVLAMDRPLISSGLKIARARADDLPCLLVQRMARFRPVVDRMTSFLFMALNTHGFVRHLLGGQTGTQLPHISGDGVQTFAVALPPLDEQTRIVAEVERRLSVVEELEAVLSANLQRATRLRQSILQKAFTGGVIVSE